MTLLTALFTVMLSLGDGGVAAPETLRIDADGFQSSTGHALARLYLPGMEVTRAPYTMLRAPIVDRRAHFEFEALPPGDYAVVVVHDLNDNGRIDHGALGLPQEPLGFSHDFRLSLFSGVPTFEKLRFAFGPGASTQVVTVR